VFQKYNRGNHTKTAIVEGERAAWLTQSVS